MRGLTPRGLCAAGRRAGAVAHLAWGLRHVQGACVFAPRKSAMADAVLHYIHDPLCGWCYAASPLVAAARQMPAMERRLAASK